MASERVDGLSDEIFDLLCYPCKVKDRNSEAKRYCFDCSDYYCCECVRFHEDIPALSGHKILKSADFSTLTDHQPSPTERCEGHKNKVIDMYCQGHDDVGCVTCMAVYHRDCRGIFFIPDFLKNNRSTLDYQTIMDDLGTTVKILTQKQSDLDCNKEQTLKRKIASIRKIKQTGETVRQRIVELEQDALDVTEDKYKPVLEEISEELHGLQTTKSKIWSVKNSSVSSGSNISQLFVVLKKSQSSLKRAGKRHDEKITNFSTGDTDITCGQKLMELLHIIEGVNNIGKENKAIGKKKKCIEEDSSIDQPEDQNVINIIKTGEEGIADECTSVDTYYAEEKERSGIWRKENEEENKLKKNDYRYTLNAERGNETAAQVKSAANSDTVTNKSSKKTNENEAVLFQSVTSIPSLVSKKAASMDESKSFLPANSANPVVIKRATSIPEAGRSVESVRIASATTFNMAAMKECNIRLQSDTKGCNVTSICSLDDGTLILVDYGNKKLKHVDLTTFTVTDYCNLPSPPWQVCSVNKQEVAVSYLGNVTEIQFVAVEGKMKMERTKRIETYHGCTGVSCGGGMINISDKNTVYVHTMSGKEIKQFPRDQPVKKVFSDISSIAASGDGSKLYVADRNKGLIMMDRNGNVRGNYGGSELKGARDTCITENGGIVVCGYDSNNVIQFGPKCEIAKVILESKPSDKKCQAVCYNAKNVKLVVGREGSDVIEVFV